MNPAGRYFRFWTALAFGLAMSAPTAAFNLNSDEPIRVSADSARLDEGQGTAVYTGDVRLVQGEASLDAERVVLYRNETGVSKIESWGTPAHYHQPARNDDTATDAWAREITWSAGTDRVTLKDQARIEQGDNQFRGDIIHYDMAQRVVTAEGNDAVDNASGRVEMVIQPRNTPSDNPETGPDGSTQSQ